MIKSIPGNDVLPEKWEYAPPGDISLSIVRDLDDLEKHADAWDRLFFKYSVQPTESYSWIKGYFKHLVNPDEAWICLFAYRDEKLVGVLPLVVRKAYRIAGVSIIMFRPPFDSFHTASIDCFMPDDNDEAFDIFFDCLRHIPHAIPIVRFREIPGSSPILKRPVLTSFARNENYISLSDDYATLRSGYSFNLQRLLKKSLKKLNKYDGVSFVLRESQRSVMDNYNRFLETEHACWKGENNTSIKAMKEHEDAMRDIAVELQKRGLMEWNFIEVAGKPVAAQFSVRVNRVLHTIKIGYNDEYKNCSPGNLLFDKVIENAFEHGDVDEINTGADCHWHKQWNIKSRKTYNVTVIPVIPILFGLLKTAHKVYNRFFKK